MAASIHNAVLLAAGDNCVVLASPCAAGDDVRIEGVDYPVAVTLCIGHKLARRAIAAGELVLKYGAPIGRATRPISPGEHIHLHNLESLYIATWPTH